MSEPRISDARTERRIDESVQLSLLGANACVAFGITPIGELNVANGSPVGL